MPQTQPRKVTDRDLAFPADVTPWLPPWGDIPSEFKERNAPYARLASKMFFEGLSKDDLGRMEIRDGITEEDAQERYRQVRAILGSFQPKHEHKEAGVAYLLSQFVVLKEK